MDKPPFFAASAAAVYQPPTQAISVAVPDSKYIFFDVAQTLLFWEWPGLVCSQHMVLVTLPWIQAIIQVYHPCETLCSPIANQGAHELSKQVIDCTWTKA